MKPTVVLLAGMLNNDKVWQPVAHGLSEQAEVRIVHFADQDTMAAMAEHAWQALADVPAAQTLALVGFSMGGYVLAQMLAEARRPVQAVALVDSAIRPETEASRINRLKTVKAIERDFPALIEQVAPWSVHPNRHADAKFMAELKAMLLEVGAATAVRQTRAIASRPDHQALMAGLRIPVQIVCGRQDKVTPPELSQEAAEQIPTAQLSWLDDTGHMSPLEQTPALTQILLGWLARMNAP
ncbi:MAG: alpha/beta hydrolase [Betaproteobacteria bacterium]